MLTSHIEKAQQMCMDAVDDVKARTVKASEAALQAVLAEVPAHKQDLEVIEAINKGMMDTRRYKRCLLILVQSACSVALCHGVLVQWVSGQNAC